MQTKGRKIINAIGKENKRPYIFDDVERIAEEIETCGRPGNFCGRLAI